MPDALKSSFIVYPPLGKNISNYFLRIKLFKEYTFTPILNNRFADTEPLQNFTQLQRFILHTIAILPLGT